ncbi:hypothetical protein [Pedobacter frigoris]|uniref:Response regulatory domain-containing protein n=1 Tax=Pedobacter frigoris TaxID=2571272 RepID=A0A4U1CDH5_9SPHI|nr:hypothetical protein [Pedobacter frigoris]TKC04254.1 hypothetical protein FA047_16810 [Pedobacter frigoris]
MLKRILILIEDLKVVNPLFGSLSTEFEVIFSSGNKNTFVVLDKFRPNAVVIAFSDFQTAFDCCFALRLNPDTTNVPTVIVSENGVTDEQIKKSYCNHFFIIPLDFQRFKKTLYQVCADDPYYDY